jgi:hypothetical protein
VNDPWLKDLPVDEIVPMAFRMGADDEAVRLVEARGDFLCAECRGAIAGTDDRRAPGGARRARAPARRLTPAGAAAARQP